MSVSPTQTLTAFDRRSFVDRTPASARASPFFSLMACSGFALMFALLPARAWPQSELASVFGIVSDSSGAVIPAAQVTIVNQSSGLTRDTISSVAGQYHLAGLPTGNYVVRAAREGFRTQVREGVALTSIEHYLSASAVTLKPGSVRGKKYNLYEWRKVCTKTYLDELDKNDMLAYIASMKEEGLSDRTCHNRIERITTFLLSV
jgi:hypothetical protein